MKSKRIGSALVIALVAVLGVGVTAASPNTSTQVSTTSGISYTDKNLQPATSYSYTVAAYDAAGNVSARSNTATGSTSKTIIPGSSDTPLHIFVPMVTR